MILLVLTHYNTLWLYYCILNHIISIISIISFIVYVLYVILCLLYPLYFGSCPGRWSWQLCSWRGCHAPSALTNTSCIAGSCAALSIAAFLATSIASACNGAASSSVNSKYCLWPSCHMWMSHMTFSLFCLISLQGFCSSFTLIDSKASIFPSYPQTEVILMCTEHFWMIRYIHISNSEDKYVYCVYITYWYIL